MRRVRIALTVAIKLRVIAQRTVPLVRLCAHNALPTRLETVEPGLERQNCQGLNILHPPMSMGIQLIMGILRLILCHRMAKLVLGGQRGGITHRHGHRLIFYLL